MGSMLQVKIRENGKTLDHLIMGGRLAVNPVVHENTAYFGSRDGYVYAYDLKERKQKWKFLAAPNDFRIIKASQLESHWPISQLVIENEHLKIKAGQHLDIGGIFAYELNPNSGKVVSKEILKGSGWTAFGGDAAIFSYEENNTKDSKFAVKNVSYSKSSYNAKGRKVFDMEQRS